MSENRIRPRHHRIHPRCRGLHAQTRIRTGTVGDVYRAYHTGQQESVLRTSRAGLPHLVARQRTGCEADSTHVMRAVIVDADSAARRSLGECCAREPDVSVVAEYSDSRAALEAVCGSPPEVLFVDVHIPPLTGLTLAKALAPSTATNVVLVSAYDRFARDAFDVNAADFLVKPFDEARFPRRGCTNPAAALPGAPREAAVRSRRRPRPARAKREGSFQAPCTNHC